MLTLVDHVLAGALIAGLPLYSVFEYRRFKAQRARRISQGLPVDNVSAYRWTIVMQWALTSAMIATWLWRAFPWSDLGVTIPPDRAVLGGWGFVIVAAATALIIALLVSQARAVHRRAEAREAVRQQIASVRDLLPSSSRELRWFYGMAVTAGICEELLYRGWLLWYLSHMMSLWAALPVSALIFGVAHSYQGAGGIAKTGSVGLIAAAMYVVSGSLWLPMLLHAAVDALSGRMTYDALTMDLADDASTARGPPAASAVGSLRESPT